MARRFIVVGAGQAGLALTAKLRALAPESAITLIGEEPVPPYQRPPLSKKYLLGDMALERLFLRPEAWYADNGIALRLGHAVESVDPQLRTVTVAGETFEYDGLALTTGSRPRLLPAVIGGTLAGVFHVRSLADVDAMAPEFRPGRRLLVVGGGYIGLEAAAVAARRGLDVTLIEVAPRILQRVAAEETSAYFRAAHLREGVEIREGCGLIRLVGEAGRVIAADLADRTSIAIDFAIVGVGIAPDVRLAEMAGLAIENGIRTDRFCRTSDPHIWAAGDCASFPGPAGQMRLESVSNAIDMGECAASNMAGMPVEYRPAPWFWSDQFDIKLQIAGLSSGYDRIVARRTDGPGGPDEAAGPGEAAGAVSHWYFRGDRLIAIDAMNDSRAYMIGKRLIEAGASPDPGVIADPEADLRQLLARPPAA